MRAGRPWTGTFSAASRSQRCSPPSSGKSSASAAVDASDVRHLARQRRDPERALALAEERTDERGHETGEVERVLDSGLTRERADVVAVVEGHRSAVLEGEHRPHVLRHRGLRPPDVVVGVARAKRERIGQGQAVGDVSVERVVGAGLVGDEVGVPAATNELRQDVRGVGDERQRLADAVTAPAVDRLHGLVEVVRELVDKAGLESPASAGLVHLDDQRGRRRSS